MENGGWKKEKERKRKKGWEEAGENWTSEHQTWSDSCVPFKKHTLEVVGLGPP